VAFSVGGTSSQQRCDIHRPRRPCPERGVRLGEQSHHHGWRLRRAGVGPSDAASDEKTNAGGSERHALLESLPRWQDGRSGRQQS
jgi:hypothetical protein